MIEPWAWACPVAALLPGWGSGQWDRIGCLALPCHPGEPLQLLVPRESLSHTALWHDLLLTCAFSCFSMCPSFMGCSWSYAQNESPGIFSLGKSISGTKQLWAGRMYLQPSTWCSAVAAEQVCEHLTCLIILCLHRNHRRLKYVKTHTYSIFPIQILIICFQYQQMFFSKKL